ncbi:MAG: flagellar biosynthetic protein FliO [Acidimicrobiia bacterium]
MIDFWLLVRLGVAFAVVLGLMFWAARLMGRHGMGTTKPSGPSGVRVEILARRGVSRNASVVVVRAGGKDFVVGVTDTAVNLLGEADADAVARQISEAQRTQLPRGAERPNPSWKALLDAVREKTVRNR